MQVVTVENFGRNSPDSEEPSGNLYGGHAWLFRFVIESVAQFFGDQIPYLVDVFEIDPRQIYRLVLYGSPGGGLYDVRLFISFTEPPTDGQIARLQVSALQKESSVENDDYPDLLDQTLTELLQNAESRTKLGLRKVLEVSKHHPGRRVKKNTQRGDYLCWNRTRSQCGNVVRMQWCDELSPRSADWNNVNFLLAEALRDKYDPVNIIHLEFRAIPETEHAYGINVEVIVPPPVQFHPIRTTLKKKRRKVDSAKVTKEGTFVIKATDPFDGLTEDDRSFRESFNRLPLDRRIRFWQKHVSPFFKAPARRS